MVVARAKAPAAAPEEGGLSHDEFMALSGLAPVPPLGRHGAVAHTAPIQYEQACHAIVACIHIDEAQAWANKADALAAWAKMYGDDRVSTEARRLKLHAYRRMAQLAEELLPGWAESRGISSPRVSSLVVLKDQGLTHGIASTVQRIGRVSESKFAKAVESEKPPTPGTLVHIESAASPEWARIKRAMSVLQTICNHHRPEPLAKSLIPQDRDRAKICTANLLAWLRRFESTL